MAVYPSPGGEPVQEDLQDDLGVIPGARDRCPWLSPDEEFRLARAVRTGDRRAAALLVEANLPLVLAVARRYAGRGVPYLDLVQDGNVGLLRAVEEFDPALGRSFSTYARTRIRDAVRQAAAERGGLVRVPGPTVDAIERLRRAAVRLGALLGREPTDEELAMELDTAPLRVARLVRLSRPPLSFQDLDGRPRVGGEGADSVPDDRVLAALRVDLHAMLARLSARERRVVHLRFGLGDGRRCSLEEVSRRLGLPRERVRELEGMALAKLRQTTGKRRPTRA